MFIVILQNISELSYQSPKGRILDKLRVSFNRI